MTFDNPALCIFPTCISISARSTSAASDRTSKAVVDPPAFIYVVVLVWWNICVVRTITVLSVRTNRVDIFNNLRFSDEGELISKFCDYFLLSDGMFDRRYTYLRGERTSRQVIMLWNAAGCVCNRLRILYESFLLCYCFHIPNSVEWDVVCDLERSAGLTYLEPG